ncbi:hypothetical protein BCR39DRAFT_548093 [Naematelia encephala]|uniref:Protein OS-9 homolog n=1 Tax=Naematelia encephala TaxID=71784 RepID=A0A1Y2AND4_9TREE|nr:hypothetical protein BCR39DRAFT_548093 [Naematelia encephala]
MLSRNLIIYLSALSVLQSDPAYALRQGSSRLRDVLAFPKYQVQFLNDLPLSTSDAYLCEDIGVEREDEFLGLRVSLPGRKRIGDGGEMIPSENRLSLIPMSLTPPGSERLNEYLCLMPSSNTTEAQNSIVQGHKAEQEEPDPVQSWQALSHLDGNCLYSKQGWFTYSYVKPAILLQFRPFWLTQQFRYCHNSHVRQFRAAQHAHPHPPGGYIPTEDATFDAYTLGQAAAPAKRKQSLPPGRAGSAPTTESAPPVSFGIGTSSRYLVQRWSDGTPCDKTGRPREIEIQFHCGLTSNDMIYSIKELAICQYVMIVHSPHLCSLAGFRSEVQDVEPAPIRCRQILSDEAFEGWIGAAGAAGGGLGLEMGKENRPRGLERGKETIGRVNVPDGLAIEGVQDAALKELLAKTLEAIAAQRAEQSDGQGESADENAEELVLLSWAEDGEGGAVLVEADLLVGGDEGADRQGLEQGERDLIMDVVRQFLGQKAGEKAQTEPEKQEEEEDKDEKRVRDEL